jgi:hypothetical protein
VARRPGRAHARSAAPRRGTLGRRRHTCRRRDGARRTLRRSAAGPSPVVDTSPMKRPAPDRNADIRAEYDISRMRGVIRGKYAASGSRVVDVPSTPSARSRGQTPASHRAQWSYARSRERGPRTLSNVLRRRPSDCRLGRETRQV